MVVRHDLQLERVEGHEVGGRRGNRRRIRRSAVEDDALLPGEVGQDGGEGVDALAGDGECVAPADLTDAKGGQQLRCDQRGRLPPPRGPGHRGAGGGGDPPRIIDPEIEGDEAVGAFGLHRGDDGPADHRLVHDQGLAVAALQPAQLRLRTKPPGDERRQLGGLVRAVHYRAGEAPGSGGVGVVVEARVVVAGRRPAHHIFQRRGQMERRNALSHDDRLRADRGQGAHEAPW